MYSVRQQRELYIILGANERTKRRAETLRRTQRAGTMDAMYHTRNISHNYRLSRTRMHVQSSFFFFFGILLRVRRSVRLEHSE